MRRALLPLFLLALFACSAPEPPRERKSEAGKYYGGIFSANESEELTSLFPLGLTQAASHRIASQIYEGLVRLDPTDLSVQPALAESWSVDATGTEYVFKLRKGVFFHDSPCFPEGKGREFTASDVVHCFTRICTNTPDNKMMWLFQDRVEGANAHYAGDTAEGLKGVEAVDGHTVRIKLTDPWSAFLQVLAHQGCWIHPKELTDHFGADNQWHPVGTGPFQVRTFERGKVMVLERFPNYWRTDAGGAQLPYLDGVRYTFEPDKNAELDAFEKGALSVVYELPVDRTDAIEGQHVYAVQTTPSFTTQFLGFNSSVPPFTDVRVRRAFNMAIDRRYLVDSVLNGIAVPADHGVVPPGLADYPYGSVPAATHDPQAARLLLAEAGYPGGRGLPTIFLQVNNNGFGYVKVAEAAQAMLERELGARVISTVLPAEQHYERIAEGQAMFWREGWIADHPDPENFLSLFYGRNAPADSTLPSYLNSTRFRDGVYDSLFAKAVHHGDVAERMMLLAKAESRLMERAVVMPLYHERSVRLLQPWVKDMPINGMEYRDLATVWFDPQLRAAR